MRHWLQEINCRLNQTEKRICELEDRSFEITESEEHNEKQGEQRDPKGLMGCHLMGQLHITGVSEREERNKWFESLFEEIVAETWKSEEGNGHTNSKWSKNSH